MVQVSEAEILSKLLKFDLQKIRRETSTCERELVDFYPLQDGVMFIMRNYCVSGFSVEVLEADNPGNSYFIPIKKGTTKATIGEADLSDIPAASNFHKVIDQITLFGLNTNLDHITGSYSGDHILPEAVLTAFEKYGYKVYNSTRNPYQTTDFEIPIEYKRLNEKHNEIFKLIRVRNELFAVEREQINYCEKYIRLRKGKDIVINALLKLSYAEIENIKGRQKVLYHVGKKAKAEVDMVGIKYNITSFVFPVVMALVMEALNCSQTEIDIKLNGRYICEPVLNCLQEVGISSSENGALLYLSNHVQ